MEQEITRLFTSSAVRRLRQFSERIEKCLQKLDDSQLWARGSSNENAIGNLMLHLNGNVRQWIISGVGMQPDVRQRHTEFEAAGGIAKEELWSRLNSTVEEACTVIECLTPAQLIEQHKIQAYDVTVLEAVLHVVEHFAQHTAQIIFATKMLTQEDMGFYKHLNKAMNAAHSEKTP